MHRYLQPKARKQHLCDECLAPIKIGKKYECQTGFEDGKSFVYRAHRLCYALATFANEGTEVKFTVSLHELDEDALKDCYSQLRDNLREGQKSNQLDDGNNMGEKGKP